jgi:ParB/RepB/Spo0J family partition protein
MTQTAIDIKAQKAVLKKHGWGVKQHGLRWICHHFASGEMLEAMNDSDLAALATVITAQPDASVDEVIAALAALDEPQAPASAAAPATADPAAQRLVMLHQIDDNPYQPRLVYDEERIGLIAASIREHGLLQVPLARQLPSGRYQLAFGHSRLRAFRKLAAVIPSDMERWGRMPLIVRELDDETMALHAWIENRDRKDLTAYEEAKAIERYTGAFGWTQQQAADKLQLNRTTVANKLRLLKLPESVLTQLRDGELSERQALALLPLSELPPATLRRAESGYGYKPSQVIASAPKHSSDDLRDQVETILRSVTVELKVDWRDFDFGELKGIESQRCADCALLRAQRCAGPSCFEVKQKAWQQRRLEQASAKLGIPALAKEPSYTEMEAYFGGHGAQIVEAGCEKLRLVAGGYSGERVTDFPELRIICAHGQSKKCSCTLRLQREHARTDPAKIDERERKKESAAVISAATEALATALAAGNLKAWRKALRAISYNYKEEATEGWDLPTIQHAMASALVKSASYYNDEHPDQMRSYIGKLLLFCDLPLPWLTATPAPPTDDVCAQTLPDVSPLADLAERLGLVEQWIARWTETPPTLDRITDLREAALAQIADELEQLSDDPDIADEVYEGLAQRIGDAELRLMQLAEVGAAPTLTEIEA